MRNVAATAQLDALAFDVQQRAEKLGVAVELWNIGISRDHRDPYFRVTPEELDRLLRIVATATR